MSSNSGEAGINQFQSSNEILNEAPLSYTALPANLEEKILDVTGRIRQRANALRAEQPTNWLPYLNAGMISEKDYSFITAFQHAETKQDRDEVLFYFKHDAFTSLVHVIQRVCIVEEIQKFLVLIDDMLLEDMSRVERFNLEESGSWKSFLDLLSCSDDFVRNISSRIISKLIGRNISSHNQSDIKFFLEWLRNELKFDNIYLLSVARCLQHLLQVDYYRLEFLNIKGMFRIVRLLSVGIKPQAQYQLVFCIWVSTFNPKVAEKMNKYGTIPILVDLLECAPAEISKLPRIIVACFRNLLEKPASEGARKHHALVMIQCKIFKYFNLLRMRTKMMNDPEHLEDSEVVDGILNKYVTELTTFDEYRLEVKSNRLEWSVVHTSKRFWEENAERLNENKYELLKILISLLESAKDNMVLCVAAHDLGHYMSYYQRGKKVVEELGGKEVLLRLLSHKHPAVKYHSLKSLQILMLNNYDLLVDYLGNTQSTDIVKKWTNEIKFGL